MTVRTNDPELWLDHLPVPSGNGNKYDRGHAVVFGAPRLTGATRLAASAVTRMGAGLVTVFARQRADVYRITLPPDIMVDEDGMESVNRPTVLLGGPGGMDRTDRALLHAGFDGCIRVFDAGAIPQPEDEWNNEGTCVLTPHDGEFARAFPDLTGSRVERARSAAQSSGAIVVLKGSETIIASPDGTTTVNDHASPWLAKAGTGDVLAGMITGLLAQGMDPHPACCAAVWLHGDIGVRVGPALTAPDIVEWLPVTLERAYDDRASRANEP